MSFDKEDYWANREAGWRGQGEIDDTPVPYRDASGKIYSGTGVNRASRRARLNANRRKGR